MYWYIHLFQSKADSFPPKSNSNIAVTISEGFDSIFRYIRLQVEQLNNEDAGGHPSTMRNVIDKIVSEEMAARQPSNGQVNNVINHCERDIKLNTVAFAICTGETMRSQ